MQSNGHAVNGHDYTMDLGMGHFSGQASTSLMSNPAYYTHNGMMNQSFNPTPSPNHNLQPSTPRSSADQRQSNACPFTSFSKPDLILPQSHIYIANYSGVQVYEIMTRGIGCMRRISDNSMNATQLLKVAGIDKARRQQILNQDINSGEPCEVVQQGNARYQGVWVPFQRARAIAEQYSVANLIRPLLEISISLDMDRSNLPADLASAPGRTTTEKRQGQPTTVDAANMTSFPKPDLGSSSDTQQLEQPSTRSRLRPSSDPLEIRGSISDDPMRFEKHRQALMAIFMAPEVQYANGSTVAEPTLPNDILPDLPLDESLNTALHWAAALSRLPLVTALVSRGADIMRGNSSGETALMRAIAASNSHEQDAFPLVLELLGPSLRTFDAAGRTAIHHIALTAGIQGRAPIARYYLDCALEYIARKEAADFGELVNAQDHAGDTALNILARLGAKSLIRPLVDVGASAAIPNRHGLRPADFGVDPESLKSSTASQNGKPATNGTAMMGKSKDALQKLNDYVDNLRAQFEREIKSKEATLNEARDRLQSATSQLADNRKAASEKRQGSAQATILSQKIQKLQSVLAQEESVEWQDSRSDEIDVPTDNTASNLKQLRLAALYYQNNLQTVRHRIEQVHGMTAANEAKYKRVVALCCGVPEDQVDTILEQLVLAIETDGSSLDVSRVSNFMSRYRQSL